MTPFQSGLLIGTLGCVTIYAVLVVVFIWRDLRRETRELMAASDVRQMPRPAYTWSDPDVIVEQNAKIWRLGIRP